MHSKEEGQGGEGMVEAPLACCGRIRRLLELMLPHLSIEPAGVELRCALYLTDASAWSWAPLLPPQRQACLPQLARATLQQCDTAPRPVASWHPLP